MRTALEVLGPDHRFRTRVYRTGPVHDGTLATIQVASAAAGEVFAKTGTFSSYDPLNRRTIVHAKGLAGYFTSRTGREIAFAIYVNNVSVTGTDPAVLAGQALGEIASIAWDVIK